MILSRISVPVYSSTFSEDNLANQESKYNKETQLNNNSAVTSNYLVEQRLNYNTTIGRHKLDAMVAMTYERRTAAKALMHLRERL